MRSIVRKFNPLGSVFVEDEHMLIVVEQNSYDHTCKGCYYAKEEVNCRNCAGHGHVCTPFRRKDRKNVVFAIYGKI